MILVSNHNNKITNNRLTTISLEPRCEETTLSELCSPITPTDSFYVRSHFGEIPELDISTWRLNVNGGVRQSFSINYNDILAIGNTEQKEQIVTIECAGNSRSYITPEAEGLKFKHGGISTARWEGIPLAHILNMAGLKDNVSEIIFHGADHGEEKEGATSFELSYTRSLPLEKALHPDTILAYKMNGERLTPDHGFPLRLIVPRWYGMASVKWLIGIEASTKPFEGFFQKNRYVLVYKGPEPAMGWNPVTTVKVKSLITSPRSGDVIHHGSFTINGMAWSGDDIVDHVDISIDGGRNWQMASLLEECVQNAWTAWEFQWAIPHNGNFLLMSRATDKSGNTQPTHIQWNFRGYANNSIHAVPVETRIADDTS